VAKKQLVADAGWATLVRCTLATMPNAITHVSTPRRSINSPIHCVPEDVLRYIFIVVVDVVTIHFRVYSSNMDDPVTVTDSRAESGHPVELLPNARTEAMVREKGYVVSVADYESDSGSVEVQQIYVNKYPRESNRLATHAVLVK
jgi:hypothetical protein